MLRLLTPEEAKAYQDEQRTLIVAAMTDTLAKYPGTDLVALVTFAIKLGVLTGKICEDDVKWAAAKTRHDNQAGTNLMASVTIKFKDASVRVFPHEGRAGGSYTKRVRYEGAFVIVTDEWGTETAFLAADIAEVESRPEQRY